ncbi:MFS transporter [Nocardiopsis suaedae]|uniref:MFS transporter n=1 Tax=Nocardiopsis suaedae TaxID=3018444 RepID=A0ABT4TS94_9ACTN|nr:MFS transporter [Nocardiopsis suaedae]MDA2807550.1 MFS transporter [Nocardiopsis suaedae]
MHTRPPLWLFILAAVLFTTATDEFIIAGVLPAIAADLEVGVGAAGQLVTAFAVAYAVGAPTVAVAADRLPRRTVMVGGLALFAAANLAAAAAPGFWALMAARVAAALCAAAVTGAAFATAAGAAPEGRQGRYLATTTAGMTAALIGGVPLGAWLAGAADWRATFVFVAVVAAAAAIGLRATAPSVAGSAPAPLRDRLRPLTTPGVLRYVGATFLAASGGLMFYSYLSVFAAETASGAYAVLTGLLFTVGVAGMAGAVLSGRWADTFGPQRALAGVLGGHAAAFALLALFAWAGWGGAFLLFPLVAVWGLFAWALTPPMQGSVIAAAGPEHGMTAMSMNIAALYLGTGAGGALGGAVVEAADASWVPAASAVLLLGSFALALGPAVAAARAAKAPEADETSGAGAATGGPPATNARTS